MSKLQKPETPKLSRKASSLKHAAGLLRVEVYELKEAKARGCPGFDDHNRVNLAEVSRWLLQEQRLKERLAKRLSPAEYFRALVVQLMAHGVAIDSACRDFWDTRSQILKLWAEHAEKGRLIDVQIPAHPAGKHLAEAWNVFEQIHPPAQHLVSALFELDKVWRFSGYDFLCAGTSEPARPRANPTSAFPTAAKRL